MNSDQPPATIALKPPSYRAEPREKILARFEELGILITDNHFVYAAGEHGDAYLDKRRIFEDEVLVQNVAMGVLEAWAMPQDFRDGYRFLGPADAGFAFAKKVYAQAKKAGGFPTRGEPICACKDDKGGFELHENVAGLKLVVIEDVMNSGKTVEQTIKLARASGAEVIAVLVICNRGTQTAESLGVPFLGTFLTLAGLKKYQPDQCPYCTDPAQQRLICTRPKVGHGEAFVARFGQPRYSEEAMKHIMDDFRIKNSK